MKRLAVAVLLAVATVSVGVIARAESPEHMRQLLSTGDCPGCDLSGSRFNQLDLRDANLEGADLSNAQFLDVQLMRADLEQANLSNTFFRNSDLTGANLEDANLSNLSSFFVCKRWSLQTYYDEPSQAEIDDCAVEILTYRLAAELCDPDLERSPLIATAFGENEEDDCGDSGYEALLYASYSSAYAQLYSPGMLLRGANLQGANLQGADFSGVDFRYAVLSDTDASTAIFDYAMLSEADLSGVEGADFERAWRNTAEMAEWIAAIRLAEAEESKRAASRAYVGAMNRAQQAYYLEHIEFSTDLSALGVGLSDDDEFEFGILVDDLDEVSIQYVLSKRGDLPSSIGVAYIVEREEGGKSSAVAICESDLILDITPDELPEIGVDDDVVTCPVGWTEIR